LPRWWPWGTRYPQSPKSAVDNRAWTCAHTLTMSELIKYAGVAALVLVVYEMFGIGTMRLNIPAGAGAPVTTKAA
jgi:hypothetical protein